MASLSHRCFYSQHTWAENFSNSPLLAAWVTHLDPPVKTLAGMASRLAGGVPSSLDQQSAIQFSRALYDLIVANGVTYQTPSGFLQEYIPGQDIKYPRDVLRDKSGTCVDLAILYASACEAVGIRTFLILCPGHSFPVIYLPDGNLLPVECTSISGAAVGMAEASPLSFDQAVDIGISEFSDLRIGLHYAIDVQDLQRKGVVSPELPRLEADILKRWGWHLPDQLPATDDKQKAVTPTSNFAAYSSQQQGLSFLYPEEWRIQEDEETIDVVHPQIHAQVTMFRVWEDFDLETLLKEVEENLALQCSDFAVTSRTKVVINGIDTLRVDVQSISTEGLALIHTILFPYENSLAKAIVISFVLKDQYATLSPILEHIFDSITLLQIK